MSTPMYKSEQAWRAHMLVAEIATRDALQRVEITIVGALVVALLSTYSIQVALGIAVAWCLTLLWSIQANTRRRDRIMNILDRDEDIDL